MNERTSNPGVLGSPVRRVEDEPLLTGAGRFVGDLVDADTLHCVFVRSQVAHGLIKPLDLTPAAAAPGVVAVCDAAALELPPIPGSPGHDAPEATEMGRPPLARDRVRFVGEPVVVVVADTLPEAVDAAESLWVDVDPLPVVNEPSEALADGVVLFPEAGSNLVSRTVIGDLDDLDGATDDVTVSVEVRSPRVSHVTMEPLAILVRPNGDGLDVWCGHQSPGRLPGQLGRHLGIPPSSIRARVPWVGGSFGLKGQLYPEYLVVAAVARLLNRAVAWLPTRSEQLVSGPHGRGQVHRVDLAGDRDGRIRRARIRNLADLGAYPNTGSRVPLYSQLVACGLYDFESVGVETTMVVTNRAPTCPYRGAGRPEAALAIERAVDRFAEAAGLDPIEVRRRNLIRSDQLPFRTVTGAIYDSGDYVAALDLALKEIDEHAVRAEQESRRDDGRSPIGLGVSAFVERTGGAIGTGEYARLDVIPSGTIEVRTGSVAAGQGHQTVWRQLASEVLTVPMNGITVIAGDTADVAQSVGSFASRSAQLGGSAVWNAACAVRERARRLAAGLLESSEDDLVLADGAFSVAGTPTESISLADVAAAAETDGDPLGAEVTFDPNAQCFPYGAHAAVVEVDVETGMVSLLRLVTVDDFGNVLNPLVVEGQLHGSVLQGLGQALLEEFIYDSAGQPLTSTLAEYLAPGTDLAAVPIEDHQLVHPAPSNPLGVKGCAESGCIGVPGAVLNAVHDALAPFGVTDLSLPLSPHKVWSALRSSPRRPGPNEKSLR